MGQGRWRDVRAGGNDEMAGGELTDLLPTPALSPLGRGEGDQLQRVWIGEAGVGADEFKFAAGKLFAAVVSELFDELVFSRHDLCEIKASFSNPDAPCFCVVDQMYDLGGVEQRFRGHTAAQDAKPADFVGAFNNDRPQARAHRGARRRKTGAPATDHRHIKVVVFVPLHGASMGEGATSERDATTASLDNAAKATEWRKISVGQRLSDLV